MRIVAWSVSGAAVALACASVPNGGPLDEGSALRPRIVSVDSSRPPRNLTVELDRPGYVAVVLVAPGHSANLIYPVDSATDNRVSSGTHQLRLQIPDLLAQVDSLGPDRMRRRPPQDSSILNPGRQRYDTTLRSRGRVTPLSPTTPTYVLLITSPQPLLYQRIVARTAGVSIPADDTEALNAVAKAVKSTIPTEPREWAGYFQRVELRKRT